MSDQLYFYSKSAPKPAGKGANEHVAEALAYAELNSISNWRKVLSNFYVHPFQWNHRTWNSVEHAFQASKIQLVDPEKAEWFTLDSGHEIGKGDGLVARKHRKLVILATEQLKHWERIKSERLEAILYAKFSQVELAKKVLKCTRDAILLHSTRGPPLRQEELERVRQKLF